MAHENQSTLVRRLDAPQSGTMVSHTDGSILAQCRFARCGVQSYMLGDGSISVEYRPPEEVFAPASMASFELRPLTLGHPSQGLLAPGDIGAYSHGTVGAVHRDSEDPNWLAANVRIVSEAAINAVTSGTVQLSGGYECDRTPVAKGTTIVDPMSGNTIYIDAILTNIRGNHVALCDAARAGPGARVLLDAADAVGVQVNDKIEEREGKWVVLSMEGKVLGTHETKEQAEEQLRAVEASKHAKDAVEPEAQEEDACKAKKDECMETIAPKNDDLTVSPAVTPVEIAPVEPVEAPKAELAPEVKPEEVKGDAVKMDELQAKADSLQVKVDELLSEVARLSEPKFLHTQVARLHNALDVASSMGFVIVSHDSMSADAIEAAVVAHTHPTLKLDSFSSDQIHTLFTSIVPQTRLIKEDTVTVSLPKDVLAEARNEQLKHFGFTVAP